MRSYRVNIELFEQAAATEVRMISKFWDHDESIQARIRLDKLQYKIETDTATKEELLEAADLIKRHCD